MSQLQKGVRAVFASQAQAARSNIYDDADSGLSGRLRDALESPRISTTTAGEGLQIMSEIPEYARFIDMKNHGNRDVYNRHIWGILYRETLGDIRHEFREWVEQNYGDQIRKIMKNQE